VPLTFAVAPPIVAPLILRVWVYPIPQTIKRSTPAEGVIEGVVTVVLVVVPLAAVSVSTVVTVSAPEYSAIIIWLEALGVIAAVSEPFDIFQKKSPSFFVAPLLLILVSAVQPVIVGAPDEVLKT